MQNLEADLDLLAIGETLVDFISTEPVEGLRHAETFQRYLGGSPANIAVNIAKLGGKSAIISKTGIGAFGQFLKAELAFNGVNTTYLVMDHRVHTSFIFISRTTATPDFEASRNGDYKLTPDEVSEEAIARSKIVHASSFALSREPCRAAVYHALRLANEQGKMVSFDPNYSPVIWPNYSEAMTVIRDIYQYATITKPSLDDARRLFGPDHTLPDYVARFHELGPQTVIFTLGKAGSIISQDGHFKGHLPARQLRVVDVTGAGDSFWAGYLVAALDGHPPPTCLLFAREIVELKLSTVGPLPAAIDRHEIYARLPSPIEALRSEWPDLSHFSD